MGSLPDGAERRLGVSKSAKDLAYRSNAAFAQELREDFGAQRPHKHKDLTFWFYGLI